MSSLDLINVGEELLDYVYLQLSATPSGVPCVKKMLVCEPMSPCCDYLSLSIDSFGESQFFSSCDEPELTEVHFRFKLLRQQNEKSDCGVTDASVAVTHNLMIDAVVLRSALARFWSVTQHAQPGTTYSIGPMIPLCGETEFCSGWTVGFSVRMFVCDDGDVSGPITVPSRCETVSLVAGNSDGTANADKLVSYK